MKAFKANMKDLFLMNGYDTDGSIIFDNSKKKLLIPKYQREYGWKDEKVKDLLADVAEHEKFLGFLILNEKNMHYEIVDGQQRLTTCFLILLSLYNAYENQPLERSDIRQIIQPVDNRFIFENESVGLFAKENGGVFQVEIDKDKDKYYQEESFKRVFSIINEKINNCKEQGTLRDFKSKFMECNFLILLNTLSDRSLSVEQLFLDVNEKAQPLEPEDIFKGYCFEKFSENHHELLKKKWVKLKELSFVFKKTYGYKDTSDYLYMYLLSKNKDIDSKLTLFGEHYLKQKEMDEVNALLDEMIQYGEKNTKLAKNVNVVNYYFEDICSDSLRYTNTSDFNAMKDMSRWLIEGSNSTTQKVPFFYFVACQDKYRDMLTHKDLRAIITNLYIYAFLFTIEKRKKGKKDLDTSLIEYLCNNVICGEKIKELSRALRVEKVDTFILPETKQFSTLSFIYSVIDNYSSSGNYIKKFINI